MQPAKMELFLPTDKSARNKKSSTQQTTLIKFPTCRSQKPLTEVKFRLNANTDLCGTTSKPTTRYSGWSGPLFTKQHQKPRNYQSMLNHNREIVCILSLVGSLYVRPSLDHKFSPDIPVLCQLQQFIRVTMSCQLANVVGVRLPSLGVAM